MSACRSATSGPEVLKCRESVVSGGGVNPVGAAGVDEVEAATGGTGTLAAWTGGLESQPALLTAANSTDTPKIATRREEAENIYFTTRSNSTTFARSRVLAAEAGRIPPVETQ
jgi:hypothetical protein